MSQGTPCSSQLIWCETRVEKLEQQLAAETKNKQEFERDWLACCDKLNDERRIHLELEETLVKKLEAAQAREKVLRSLVPRELPGNFIGFGEYYAEHADKYAPRHDEMRKSKIDYIDQCLEARATPSDDTALKSALAAERARCIAAVKAADDCGCGVPCDCYSVGTAIYAIKALGD